MHSSDNHPGELWPEFSAFYLQGDLGRKIWTWSIEKYVTADALLLWPPAVSPVKGVSRVRCGDGEEIDLLAGVVQVAVVVKAATRTREIQL